nr:MAG TPA: hypothetical protein [Caudoviricetes sp.]
MSIFCQSQIFHSYFGNFIQFLFMFFVSFFTFWELNISFVYNYFIFTLN